MKVVLLGVDDWEALYINGEKHDENHSLGLDYTLEAIAKKFYENGETELTYEHYYAEPDQDMIDSGGVYYPDLLKDVEPELRGPIEP